MAEEGWITETCTTCGEEFQDLDTGAPIMRELTPFEKGFNEALELVHDFADMHSDGSTATFVHELKVLPQPLYPYEPPICDSCIDQRNELRDERRWWVD